MERSQAEEETCGASREDDFNEKRTLRERLEIDAVTHHENHEP